MGSSFFLTSIMGQDSGPALALLVSDPVRCFHSPVDSSYTFRERLDLGAMPRWSANSSHLDFFLGGGGGFNDVILPIVVVQDTVVMMID